MQLQRRIIYLACPYTDPSRFIREKRFQIATAAAAELIKRGYIVFSPITMTHPIDVVLAGETTLGSEYWVKFDEAFMDFCTDLIVLQVEGWDSSSGISREIEYFAQAGKPVRYHTAESLRSADLGWPSEEAHTKSSRNQE